VVSSLLQNIRHGQRLLFEPGRAAPHDQHPPARSQREQQEVQEGQLRRELRRELERDRPLQDSRFFDSKARRQGRLESRGVSGVGRGGERVGRADVGAFVSRLPRVVRAEAAL
jgi:hypothetical protein